jgi:low affinity Fe/Cu permease
MFYSNVVTFLKHASRYLREEILRISIDYCHYRLLSMKTTATLVAKMSVSCTVLVTVVLLQPNFTLFDRRNKRLPSIKFQWKETCYMLTDGQT